MTDWTNITDSQVDPDAPVTSELGYAWRDNPVAIAEGAAGAPRIAWQSLMQPTAGSAFENPYPLSVSTPGGVIVTRYAKMQPVRAGNLRARLVVAGDAVASIIRENGSVIASGLNAGTHFFDFPYSPDAVIGVTLSDASPTSGSAVLTLFSGTDAVLCRMGGPE